MYGCVCDSGRDARDSSYFTQHLVRNPFSLECAFPRVQCGAQISACAERCAATGGGNLRAYVCLMPFRVRLPGCRGVVACAVARGVLV